MVIFQTIFRDIETGEEISKMEGNIPLPLPDVGEEIQFVYSSVGEITRREFRITDVMFSAVLWVKFPG